MLRTVETEKDNSAIPGDECVGRRIHGRACPTGKGEFYRQLWDVADPLDSSYPSRQLQRDEDSPSQGFVV
jgi:hypothetical protein